MIPQILLAQDAGYAQASAVANDPYSVVAIIAVGGGIVLGIVIAICITSIIQRVYTIRASNTLIMELVNKGFSAEEIERIAYGNTKFGTKVGRFFRDARNGFRKDGTAHGKAPVPPVKAVG